MTRIEPDIEQDSPLWDGLPQAEDVVARALRAAAARCGATLLDGAGVSVLLTDDAHMREINRDWRKQDKPTNVLSFPAAPNKDGYRGDIALALGVTRREAKLAGKRLGDHAVHLVVHGVLHLAGHDHVRASDAKKMEKLEIAILQSLGVANPYEMTP